MNPLIKGIHHAGIKPTKEKFEEVIAFYTEVLELEMTKSWIKEGKRGAMMAVGESGFMEIIENDEEGSPFPGGIEHLAFHVTDTDAMIEKVRKAGYDILVEPKDVCLLSEPPYLIRVGFCKGAAGEKIEFFCER